MGSSTALLPLLLLLGLLVAAGAKNYLLDQAMNRPQFTSSELSAWSDPATSDCAGTTLMGG